MKRDGKHFGRKKEKRRNPSSSPIELSTEINKGQDYTKFTDEISTDDSNISTSSEKEEKKDKLFEKVENIDLEGGLGISENNQGKKKVNPLQPILKNINFEIKQGEFVCIIGEVGCGKSSLLQAILNNMLSLARGSKIYVNGSISYVSQIPWIRNATIKDNILFYQPYNEEKYNIPIKTGFRNF